MDKGWIKLHRRMQEHWLYPSDRTFTEYEAWQDILLSVNYKSQKVRIKNNVFLCGRGESLRSIKSWGRRWNWSKSKVYRFFKLLEDEGMINTKSETLTTRLSVCNYDTYQDTRNGDETEMERKRNAGETESYPNKKGNKGKKEKNIPPTREEVQDYFSERGDMILSDIPLEAENFINHYSDKGWKNSSEKKIKNWKRQAATWNNKYLQYNEDRLKNNGSTNGQSINLEIPGLS